MSIDNQEITINLDAKRIAAIAALAVISIYTLYTYSVALFAFIAPFPGDTPLATTINCYDQYGATPGSFSKGSTITVKGHVERATAYFDVPTNATYVNFSDDLSCLVFITIMDDYNMPVYYYKYSITLSPGEIFNYQRTYTIPTDASSGPYMAKVLVWTTNLPDGVKLSAVKTDSVVVT